MTVVLQASRFHKAFRQGSHHNTTSAGNHCKKEERLRGAATRSCCAQGLANLNTTIASESICMRLLRRFLLRVNMPGDQLSGVLLRYGRARPWGCQPGGCLAGWLAGWLAGGPAVLGTGTWRRGGSPRGLAVAPQGPRIYANDMRVRGPTR